MKNLTYSFRQKVITIIFLFTYVFCSNSLLAQQSLIKVQGWNAYVHLPWDYYANPTATYPTIVFFPGLGEVGTNASLAIRNGPGAYITQGWNGNVLIGVDSVKFIVISLQPDKAWPIEKEIDKRIQTLKKSYRIDNSRLHLTGLSMGGWASTTYVTGDNYGGPYTYAGQIATVVEVEGVRPDDNAPYPQLFDNFAKSGGRLLGFEQINDARDILSRVNRMNYTRPGSGIFVSTNFGGGGHCCWQQFYGGSGTQPGVFLLDGINQNIYQWIARNPAPVSGQTKNIPPVPNAGVDKSITLPVSSVTLTGSGTDANGTVVSYAWSKISGPSGGNIVSSNSATTVINGLVQGTYQYQLTVTDNNGATGKDLVNITVNAAVSNIPPVANAGANFSIQLPASTAVLYGSGTDADGTVVGYLWTKISGASGGNIVTPNTPATTIYNLVQGIYQYQLTVTDNNGATSKATVTVTVKGSATNIAPTANAGSDIKITSPANTSTLYGSGTDANGTVVSYLWTQISGASATIVSPTKATTSVAGLNSVGSYTFRLTVTDDAGATTFDDIIVKVASASYVSGQRKMIPIAPDGGIYFVNKGYLQPGDTGCIQSGTYPYISIDGVVGTAAQPIVITNCGGQVINTGNNGTSYCYRIVNSRFFKFTGTGASGINYGFKAFWKGGFTGAGMSVRDGCSDYEIDHFEAQNVQNGFLCKIDPYDCDPASWSTGWTINNISFHDNYVHNTTGEGYYIINTSATVTVKDCKGNYITVEPVKANGVKLYNNICDSTGWDGIQVAASTNTQIYNNKVTNYGLFNMASQQAGILLGGKSDGSIYGNYISGGTGEGLEIFGTNRVYVYNNVVANAGWDGSSTKQDAIAIDDRPQPYNFYGGLQVYVLNNTVVNAGRNAVHIFNSYGTMATGNKINNNLLVKPNNTSPYDNPYANIDGHTVVDTSKNVRLSIISVANFVNSVGGDYHLLSTSPAIDKGLDASAFGVKSDFDGIARPQGAAYDAGAFEYNTGTKPPAGNQPPVSNAGSNQVIQLPMNNVFLDGSNSTDPDGTIVSYKWSVVSGPSGSSFTASANKTTTLMFVNTGIYTIRLTVSDNGGLSSSTDITVTFQAAAVIPPPISMNGKAIHVNIYDGKTPYNNSQWNNWNVNSSLTSNKFSYDDGSSSGVSAYLSSSQRIVDNGSNYSSSVTVCPSQVLQLNSITTSDRVLTINGLDPTKVYRIELYASRANSKNDTRFVIGNVADTISIDDNVNDYAKFDNVSPTNTHIDIDIQRLNIWQYLAGFSIIDQSNNLGSYSLRGPSNGTDEDAATKTPGTKASGSNETSLTADFILLSNNMLTIKLNSGQQQLMHLSVTDVSGRTYLKTNVSLQKGYNSFSKYVPGISKGIYYIKLFTNDNFIVKPLLNSAN